MRFMFPPPGPPPLEEVIESCERRDAADLHDALRFLPAVIELDPAGVRVGYGAWTFVAGDPRVDLSVPMGL